MNEEVFETVCQESERLGRIGGGGEREAGEGVGNEPVVERELWYHGSRRTRREKRIAPARGIYRI